MVLLAMPSHHGNLYALEQLRHRSFPGKIAAVVEYPDEIQALKEAGADAVFHVYSEAGVGFADDAAKVAGLVDPNQGQAC